MIRQLGMWLWQHLETGGKGKHRIPHFFKMSTTLGEHIRIPLAPVKTQKSHMHNTADYPNNFLLKKKENSMP